MKEIRRNNEDDALPINRFSAYLKCLIKGNEDKLKLFSLFFVLYLLSAGNWVTSNDMNCIYLANTFLKGKFYLTELPCNQIDLAFYDNKWYSPFPPLPSLIVAPFVYVLGLSYNVRYVTIFFGSLNVVLAWSLLQKVGIGNEGQRWLTLLFSLGSIHWFYSVTLFNHIYSVFFLLVAMNESLSRNNPVFLGFCLGCAGLCRYPTLLGAPFFLLGLGRHRMKNFFGLFLLGLMIPLSFLFYYNYTRFGNPLETGYIYQINLIKSPKPFGIFNPQYMFSNLYTFFLEPMSLTHSFPFLLPHISGLALTFTTPASVFALRVRTRNPKILGSWLSVLLMLIFLLCYFSNGADQFGYRYGLDFFPFLFLLISQGVKNPLTSRAKSLIIVGVLVNFWGVLFFNKNNLQILSYFLD